MKKYGSSKVVWRVLTLIGFLLTVVILCIAETNPPQAATDELLTVPVQEPMAAVPEETPDIFTGGADPVPDEDAEAVDAVSLPVQPEIIELDAEQADLLLSDADLSTPETSEAPEGEIKVEVSAQGPAQNADTKNQISDELELKMQKTISVDFRELPVEDVLRIIAEQADVDIIKSPNVQGAVTAKLTDVPLEEALNNILVVHGYAYVATRNMIRVGTTSEINDVSERLVNRVYRIIYADVKEVETAIGRFISSRGSISASPSTSNIIVTDTESRIKAIDDFINEIDRQTPQVLVEVRIYDVTMTDNYDMGIAWNIGANNTDQGAPSPDRVGDDYGIPTTDAVTRTNSLFSSGSFDKDNGGAIRIGLLNDSIDIDIMFQMLHKDIGAKLLANPRIMVLDNGTANFKIVREIPYTEITESSAGGSLTSTKFKPVGIELLVTPHITRENMLRLHINPKFGVVVGNLTQGQPPTVDTREILTSALVRDQQTVVLGGLRKRETSQTIRKIPVLGDIPLVGGLFRDSTEEVVTNELMIFITPKVVIEPKLLPYEAEVFGRTDVPPASDDNFDRFEQGYDRYETPKKSKDSKILYITD